MTLQNLEESFADSLVVIDRPLKPTRILPLPAPFSIALLSMDCRPFLALLTRMQMKLQEKETGRDVGKLSRTKGRSGERSDWYCEEIWDVNQAVGNWRE